MKRELTLVLTCLSLFFLFNCSGNKPVRFTSGADPGWLVFNYPRTTWAPGYVFRIKDGENTPQQVTTLRARKSYDTGYAYLPGQYQKRSFSGDAFLKFLFLNANDSTLKAKGENTIEVDINIGQAFSESIDEPLIDSLIKNSNISWRENNKYYIVQETLSTKKIKYKNLTNGSMGFNAILNFKMVNSAGRISKDTKDSTYLNQDFDRNYRVYYKAIEINPMGAASTNTKHYTYKKVNRLEVSD